MLEVARSRGFKGIVALRGDVGLALAHEYKPDAIVLDMQLPGLDGWAVLDHLKRHPDTRHIPVHVVTGANNGRQHALRAGAVAFLAKPIEKEHLEETFAQMSSFLERDIRNLLVVDDDETQRQAIGELLGDGDDVRVTAVGSSEEALAELERRTFDCMVLDLKLPDDAGLSAARAGEDRPALLEPAGDHLHRQAADAHRGDEAPALCRDDHRQGRSLARAAARRDLAVPPPRRVTPSRRRSESCSEQLHSADAIFEGEAAS